MRYRPGLHGRHDDNHGTGRGYHSGRHHLVKLHRGRPGGHYYDSTGDCYYNRTGYDHHHVTTAWVLRGGASFGAAQVGMATALIEAGHHPDRLYGTSAGALNASLLAADPSPAGLTELTRLWTVVRRTDVFPLNLPGALAGIAGRRDHLVSAAALARWLKAFVPLRRLEDGVLPLAVMATDLETGEEVLLESGPAVPALLASCALPGIFPPVRLGERWLIDGSVVCDTPLGPAVTAGAERVFVLPSVPSVAMGRPRSALNVLLRSSAISLARLNSDAVTPWSTRCQLFIVPAPVVAGISPFSFSHSQALIDAAYELTSHWLAGSGPDGPPPAQGPLRGVKLQGVAPEM